MNMNSITPRCHSALALLLVLGLVSAFAQEPRRADGDPAKRPPGPEAPEDPATRAAWITSRVERVAASTGVARDAAIKSLVDADKDGDCIHMLVALLSENKKNTGLLVAIIRGFGRDGLELAAPAVADQLTHRHKDVRGNAAVSLEYIGSSDKKVLAALKKLVIREKDVFIANHAYRALGRCGLKDSKVRALLLKKAHGAKSEYASYGPCIGLAYFEGDRKVARSVEKLLKKIGVPGGGKHGSEKGGATNSVKRNLVSWTLANVGDAGSANFVIEELMPRLKHVKATWAKGLLNFWDSVARVCDGEKQRMAILEGGVRAAVRHVKGHKLERYGAETRHLMDDYRKGREAAGFTPRGDHILDVKYRKY